MLSLNMPATAGSNSKYSDGELFIPQVDLGEQKSRYKDVVFKLNENGSWELQDYFDTLQGGDIEGGISSFIIPDAKISIDNELGSISSSDSKSSQGEITDISWSLYKLNKLEETPFEYSFIGKASSDEEINSISKKLEYGMYIYVLTVTNSYGITNSSEEILYTKNKQTLRKYGWIAKKSIKRLIISLDRGWAGYIASKVVSHNYIKYKIIPKLRKMSKQTEIYGEQVVGLLMDALMKAGVGQSKARSISEMIVAVVL